MQKGAVIPGQPLVERICAKKGTVGERILEEIAHPASQPMRHKRDFGSWIRTWGTDGHETCRGSVAVNGLRIPLTLQRGDEAEVEKRPRTLIIEEVQGRCLSLKPKSDGNGALVLRVGNGICDNRLKSFATQVVAVFIIHGFGWQNRRGKVFSQPYGADADGRQKRKSRQRIRRDGYDRYARLW